MELRAELTRLQDADAHGRPEVLGRLQLYLLNAGAAWQDADTEHRNRLARALFETVLIRNQHVVAIRPRAEFQPYFALLEPEAPTPSTIGRRCHTEERGGGPEGSRNYVARYTLVRRRLRGALRRIVNGLLQQAAHFWTRSDRSRSDHPPLAALPAELSALRGAGATAGQNFVRISNV